MLSTTDVYTAASSMGQELQLLIDEHGHEYLDSLMFDIINILEKLENCVNLSAEMKVKISDMQNKHESLKLERQSFTDLRDGYDKNVEQLQQSWYRETQALLDEASQLEKENQRLIMKCDMLESTEKFEDDSCNTSLVSRIIQSTALAVKPTCLNLNAEEAVSTSTLHVDNIVAVTEKRLASPSDDSCAADLQLIRLLKIAIAEQNMERRKLRRQILQTEASLDAAEEEVYRLARQSGKLSSLRSPTHRQTCQLAANKATVESELRVCEQQIQHLLSIMEHSDSHLSTKLPAADLLIVNSKPTLSITDQMPLHISPGQGVESAETALRTEYTANNLGMLEKLIYERSALRCRIIELDASLQQLEDKSEETVFGPIPMEPLEKLRPDLVAEKSGIRELFSLLLLRTR